MIDPNDTGFSLDTTLRSNDVFSTEKSSLTSVMDKLQETGLLGLSPAKRQVGLKDLSADQVKELQTTLVNAGFKDVGNIDGIGGSKTLKGIEQALAKNTLNEIFAEADASDKETVRRIQESLNTLGHDAGKEDGAFGSRTANALGRYLNTERLDANNLPENVRGRLTEFSVKLDTQTAIEVPSIAVRPLAVLPHAVAHAFGVLEQTEDDVKAIQGFLNERGYDTGKVDGDFGPRTTSQFVKFLEENPQYHSMMGPTSIFLVEIAASDKESGETVSDDLKRSLNLRDLSKLPTPTDDLRYQAYKDYFREEGKPEELARGIKVASEMTGIPMEKLFVVMKQESINFGDYNPARGNSSANRLADNYGQFTNQTKRHMDENYGDDARRELGREGIQYSAGTDWRNDPLVAPYMVAQYLKETGSYPAYVLPAMRGRENSNAVVSSHYPEAAASNKHILGDGRTFKEARNEIMRTLEDDIRDEREIVRQTQLKVLKEDLLKGRDPSQPYYFDRIDPDHRLVQNQTIAGLVGDQNNPENAVTAINFRGSFAKASDLIQIADISPDGKGPRPSGWTPSNEFL